LIDELIHLDQILQSLHSLLLPSMQPNLGLMGYESRSNQHIS